jgi:hypothetical protein
MTPDDIVKEYRPITLEEMSSVKLMNRIDTKFVMPIATLCQLLEMAKGDYRVQDTESGGRNAAYHTVYMDTAQYEMYRAHVVGHSGRQKIRVRSYVDSHLHFLEVKTKNNHGRTKKKRVSVSWDIPAEGTRADLLRPLDDRQLADTLQGDTLAFVQEKLRYDSQAIHPVIENRFHRITLVNSAMTERLTIDQQLQFDNLRTGQHLELPTMAIVELKRDGQTASPVLAMFQQLRVHPQGFSKYAMGLALTDPQLHPGRLKPRLMQVWKRYL